MRSSLTVGFMLACAGSALAGNVAYVGWSAGEPWGMQGNVNALNDVFGNGNWSRLNFPTAAQDGVFDKFDCIILDGGDGADTEFNEFVNNNRAAMEAFVNAGGKMLINAARWGADPVQLDVGFGVTLDNSAANDTGTAVDTNHPIYQGPFGVTGGSFDGDWLAHDFIYGSGLTSLMIGDTNQGVILAEKDYGAGHVVFGGLTLPFFGEHGGWSANTKDFHRNLYNYVCEVPSPGAASLLALAGLAAARRRR